MSVHPDCEKRLEAKMAVMKADGEREKERYRFARSGICPDCSGDLIDKTGFLGLMLSREKYKCSSCYKEHIFTLEDY